MEERKKEENVKTILCELRESSAVVISRSIRRVNKASLVFRGHILFDGGAHSKGQLRFITRCLSCHRRERRFARTRTIIPVYSANFHGEELPREGRGER